MNFPNYNIKNPHTKVLEIFGVGIKGPGKPGPFHITQLLIRSIKKTIDQ